MMSQAAESHGSYGMTLMVALYLSCRIGKHTVFRPVSGQLRCFGMQMVGFEELFDAM